MKTYCLPLIILLIAICSGKQAYAESTANNDEFETLMQKIRKDFAANPSIDKILKEYNDKDGSFADVDYASIQRTNWPPLVHIDRIYDFVFAYTNPQNKYYKDNALYEKIVKGLEFWHQRNPWCHNWWYNQIAEPQKLGVLLIQMRTGARQIPADLEKRILDRIRTDGGDPAKWTGANRTDIALHWIYRSCLSRNEADLKKALENVYNPIVYTTEEGFQYDNSYFQHGRQLYIGGYGDEILKGITQVAMYTKGTQYALPKDKLDIVSKFMRETYYRTIRGQYMLFDAMGRSVSRPGVPNKSATALFASRMIELDPQHKDEYKAIVERLQGKKPAEYQVTPSHTHYFKGDYTLHVRPAYTFDVRMTSTRTSRLEYGNGENLKPYFVSDGCTNIVRRGNEYDGIFPVWNWTRIPGVTAPQLDSIPFAISDWQTPGTSTFAGGVSDSLYGATAYVYTDNYKGINTGAHKAWFFFDDEVVCLGSGISSTSESEVQTTVNQCLASTDEPLYAYDKQILSLSLGQEKSAGIDWAVHDNIGYLFPEGGTIFISHKNQSGNWYAINNSVNRKENIQKKVFTIGFEHGKHPQNATYAYIVVPGKGTASEMQAYQKADNVRILSNTKQIQAVCNRSLNLYQAIFYQPGELADGNFKVKTDKPCALMVKKISGGKPVLHVADPGQTGQSIRIDITVSGKKYSIEHHPSTDPIYAGATTAYNFQFTEN